MSKPTKTVDVMIDLETTGVSAGCAILSIGACTFNLEETFYSGVSLDDCTKKGLKTDYHTMKWWNEQDVQARTKAFGDKTPLITALGRFSDWIKQVRAKHGSVYVWGNGADFDLPILKGAYEAAGMLSPWGAFTGRCYRTLKNSLIGKTVEAGEFTGLKHYALDDAKHQAAHAVRILQKEKELLSSHQSKQIELFKERNS